MSLNYMLSLAKYLNKQQPFYEFLNEINDYIKTVNPGELTLFYDYLTDFNCLEFDSDMIMLMYCALWLIPNRLNQQCQIQGADNIYTTFLKSVMDDYKDIFNNRDYQIIEYNMNYSIYQRSNLLIILNHLDVDLKITLPENYQNQVLYCVNCGDELEVEKDVELYPYGFYLLIKE